MKYILIPAVLLLAACGSEEPVKVEPKEEPKVLTQKFLKSSFDHTPSNCYSSSGGTITCRMEYNEEHGRYLINGDPAYAHIS